MIKVTPCPMNTLSSMTTPSQIKLWLEILQRFAHRDILLNFDECADLCLIPDLAPVQIYELREPDVVPSLTSSAIQL